MCVWRCLLLPTFLRGADTLICTPRAAVVNIDGAAMGELVLLEDMLHNGVVGMGVDTDVAVHREAVV